MNLTLKGLFLWGVLLILSSCVKTTESPGSEKSDTTATDKTPSSIKVSVRQNGEADRLNPMLTTSGYSTDIFNNIFFPLMEFNPNTLEYNGLLVKGMPEIKFLEDGPLKGGRAFTFEIREEAKWDDGTPVTAADYLFTVKAIFNPNVDAGVYRGYLQSIKKIDLDKDNPKIFTVTTFPDYMLALYITSNFSIYPEHIYDPEGLLREIDFETLTDLEKADEFRENEKLIAFADAFHDVKFARDPDFISGSGPYKLKEWISGQKVVIEKKENWWGNAVGDLEKEFKTFDNSPNEIIFEIIPDQTAAVAKLKDQGIDAMGGLDPKAYQDLKKNELVKQNFNFFEPTFLQYLWLPINTRDPLLADKRVRRALAHLLDLDKVSEELLEGMGQRISGPFHPIRPYYNKNLEPREFSVDKAAKLLKEAGWEDTDGNGIVDKSIQGRKQDLKLTYHASRNPTGRQIGVMLSENARRVGVEIEVIEKDFNVILNDLIKKGKYHIAPLRSRQLPMVDDPYQVWHTDNDREAGGNYTGFGNAKSDALIEAIRAELDEEKRNELFKELQEIIYDEQPGIFLVAIKDGIITNKRFEVKPSSLRPGFFPRNFIAVDKE